MMQCTPAIVVDNVNLNIQPRKFKLNATSGAGHKEVKVKTI